ncbi:MAG TPA: hypothetical protein VE177_00240, partial [Candidatus Binatus sp.]|nr:hypothetical protein [Candidatus Binatus sp.]
MSYSFAGVLVASIFILWFVNALRPWTYAGPWSVTIIGGEVAIFAPLGVFLAVSVVAFQRRVKRLGIGNAI